MKNFMKEYEEGLKAELNQFLFLCGTRDRNIVLSAAKKSKIDDYVRLSCIAVIFGYKKTFLKIAATAEKFMDDYMNTLKTVGNDFTEIDRWTTEFINNMENDKARQVANDYWAEQKATIDRNNFNIRQLFT